MRFLMMMVVLLIATPALAKDSTKASPALAKLAAEYLKAHPKDVRVLAASAGLAEETGGKVWPFEEAQTAAKAICDELRKNRRPS